MFFCDIEKNDENGYVKMFDKSGELLSDNYFGYSELYEILTEKRNEIISSTCNFFFLFCAQVDEKTTQIKLIINCFNIIKI